METNATSPLLKLQGRSASVGDKPILHDIDLAIGAHETHVMMGPNGAGKSTLGHVIMGDPEYSVTSGTVTFDGQDITDLSPDKRSRAGLFLSFEGREGFKMKGKEFRKHVRELAKSLDFDPAYLDRELGVGFSGGEKKKLEMLQLLLLKPKLAVLDETDSGLDVDALGVVSRGIQEYRKTCDGTLIIITHNTRILEHVDVDRVHVMVKGHLVHEDNAALIADIDAHGFERFEQAATPEADA